MKLADGREVTLEQLRAMRGEVLAHGCDVRIDQLRVLARERDRIHRGHRSSRPLSDEYQLIGLCGEWEFSRVSGLPMNVSIVPEGDGGVDFYTVVGTVDTKTAKKPWYLLREVEKGSAADILVLAQYFSSAPYARLLGWEADSVMVEQPIRTFSGGIPSYAMRQEELRPMRELLDMLCGQCQGDAKG